MKNCENKWLYFPHCAYHWSYQHTESSNQDCYNILVEVGHIVIVVEVLLEVAWAGDAALSGIVPVAASFGFLFVKEISQEFLVIFVTKNIDGAVFQHLWCANFERSLSGSGFNCYNI